MGEQNMEEEEGRYKKIKMNKQKNWKEQERDRDRLHAKIKGNWQTFKPLLSTELIFTQNIVDLKISYLQ